RVRTCSPGFGSIDDDRGRVTQRVVRRRLQLDLQARTVDLARVRIVGLDGHDIPAGLDADSRPRHRLTRLQITVHEVYEYLGLKLRLPLATHRPEHDRGAAFA